MGMYTEFHFAAHVRNEEPVLAALRYMIDDDTKPESLPDHPLFSTRRWDFMMRGGSSYFGVRTSSALRAGRDGCSDLRVSCALKNYDSEIEKFLDWIGPYIQEREGDLLGFYLHEESEQPTFIYHTATPAQQPR